MSHKKNQDSAEESLKLAESIIESYLIAGKKIPLDFKHNFWRLQLLSKKKTINQQQGLDLKILEAQDKKNLQKLNKNQLISLVITLSEILNLKHKDYEALNEQLSFLENFFEKVIAQQKTIRDKKHLNKSNKRSVHDLNWKYAQESYAAIYKSNPNLSKVDLWKKFKASMACKACSVTTVSNYFKKLYVPEKPI
ncbi:MAG: hypothetical protein EBS31_06590 [Burkholderiaceae bacterium]|nr:hypothetical protein [Burkholderiaceae bacterium]